MIAGLVVAALTFLFLRWRRRRRVVKRQDSPLAGRDTGTRHVHRQPTRTNRGF